MTRRGQRQAWLHALWGAALGLGFGLGCSDGTPSSQVLTGRIDTTRVGGVVAIRAVTGSEVISAGEVGRDGRFRIALPTGAKYRLEVLTTSGVKPMLHASGGWKAMEVEVCMPTAPFDMGTIGNANEMCDPMGDPNTQPPGCGGTPPPGCTDPMDPDCKPGCDPMNPTGPNCQPDPCSTNPMQPGCQPPPACGGMNQPPCPPDPCSTNPMDPNCKPEPPGCNPMDPMDPNCGGGMDPGCPDPTDPMTCKDPCVIDPMSCGCDPMEPNCWPPPGPPPCMDPTSPGMCDPASGMSPTHVPGNFGCIDL